MNAAERDALAGKWIIEAQKHEMAAREIEEWSDNGATDESQSHREIAAVLYRCAQDLQHPEPPPRPPEEEIRF